MERPSNVSQGSWGRLLRDLLLMLAIIGSFAYVAFPIASIFGWLSRPESRLAVFLIGSICGELAALGFLVWLLRRRGASLGSLGWMKPTTWQAILLGIIIALVYSGVTALNPSIGPFLFQFTALKILALVSAIVAGVVEEVIFRGYVMTAVAAMNYRGLTQVLVSGATFAIAHVYGFASPGSLLITQSFTFLLGTALGVLYLVGKRSLTPVILSHALIDAIIEPWLLLSFFAGAY